MVPPGPGLKRRVACADRAEAGSGGVLGGRRHLGHAGRRDQLGEQRAADGVRVTEANEQIFAKSQRRVYARIKIAVGRVDEVGQRKTGQLRDLERVGRDRHRLHARKRRIAVDELAVGIVPKPELQISQGTARYHVGLFIAHATAEPQPILPKRPIRHQVASPNGLRRFLKRGRPPDVVEIGRSRVVAGVRSIKIVALLHAQPLLRRVHTERILEVEIGIRQRARRHRGEGGASVVARDLGLRPVFGGILKKAARLDGQEKSSGRNFRVASNFALLKLFLTSRRR